MISNSENHPFWFFGGKIIRIETISVHYFLNLKEQTVFHERMGRVGYLLFQYIRELWLYIRTRCFEFLRTRYESSETP
jgi:hypothetical protein